MSWDGVKRGIEIRKKKRESDGVRREDLLMEKIGVCSDCSNECRRRVHDGGPVCCDEAHALNATGVEGS